MTPADRASPRAADRKATLFCPACGREAPFDGGWIRDAGDADRTDVTCPECGDVVVSQPQFPGRNGGGIADVRVPGGGAGAGTVVRPVLQFVNAVVRHDVL